MAVVYHLCRFKVAADIDFYLDGVDNFIFHTAAALWILSPLFFFVCVLCVLCVCCVCVTPRMLHCDISNSASFTSPLLSTWLPGRCGEATPPSGCCTSTSASASADLPRSLSVRPARQSAFALFAFRLKPLQIERTRQVRAPEESGWCPTSLCSRSLLGFSSGFLLLF